MRWIITLLVFVSMACSKMEEIGSVRILGSNTEDNFFNETTDDKMLFLKKNEMYLLDNSFVSNLSLSKLALDSIDIERVAGDSDTLLLMTKIGLSAYFSKTHKRVSLKNYNFSFCDKMALIDSMIVVVQGKTDCQPGISPKYSLLKLNKKTELEFIKQYSSSDQIIDIKVISKNVLMLSASGLGIYEIKNAGEISKISEIAIANSEFMRVIPSLNKVLVKTNKGMVQLKVLANNSLEKINEL